MPISETAPSTVNVPLLRKTLESIETLAGQRYPHDTWLQNRYMIFYYNSIADQRYASHRKQANGKLSNACGTAHCFAGEVALATAPVGTLFTLNGIFLPGERWAASYSGYARNELGISSYEASELFNGENSLDDLRRIVGEIIERAESNNG